MERVLRRMRFNKKFIIPLLVLTILGGLGFYVALKENQVQEKKFALDKLRSRMNSQLRSNTGFTLQDIRIDGEDFKINYSFNDQLQSFIQRRLRYYRPDKSAIVVIDNNNGGILASVGYDRKQKSFDYILPFTGTHPSASIFKIVTTTELMEDGEVEADTKYKFRGRGTTLYKYQLKEKKSRWSRKMSFEKAFAFSNNVIFGKAAIENTTPYEITEMAERLGFNQELMEEISLSKSTFIMPKEGYNLAEIASGFNKKTQMSPVHCAVLSQIIANDGELIYPRLVEDIVDKEKHYAWKNDVKKKRVIKKEVADDVKDLMLTTVNKGTARRQFRYMRRSIKKKLLIGGKTGSITGGFPHGKRDWFTAFAYPKDATNKGISVCVMNINFEKWYVKSTKMAQEVIQYYYTKIDKL